MSQNYRNPASLSPIESKSAKAVSEHRALAEKAESLSGKNGIASKIQRGLANKALESHLDRVRVTFAVGGDTLDILHQKAIDEDQDRQIATIEQAEQARMQAEDNEASEVFQDLYFDAQERFDTAKKMSGYDRMAPYDKAVFIHDYLSKPKNIERFPFISSQDDGSIRIQGNSSEQEYLVSLNTWMPTLVPTDVYIRKPIDGLVEIDFYERTPKPKSGDQNASQNFKEARELLQAKDAKTAKRSAFILASKQAVSSFSPQPMAGLAPRLKMVVGEESGSALLRKQGTDTPLPMDMGIRFFSAEGEELDLRHIGYRDVSRYGNIDLENVVFGLKTDKR